MDLSMSGEVVAAGWRIRIPLQGPGGGACAGRRRDDRDRAGLCEGRSSPAGRGVCAQMQVPWATTGSLRVGPTDARRAELQQVS